MATEKDYYGVGILRGQRHIPSKNEAKLPPPPHPPFVENPVNQMLRRGFPTKGFSNFSGRLSF